ncbi:hypothetical protein PR202_gb14155 [Eleusine coracana subsp. coracana]|uniref:Uncharacterized protein n=1 Tax=Eleusine coracana subsp. coracana TaxID=191504 RepID=A0AAV5ETS3_ELECO|nr:hypothetical protein PR202_gb14155 [Eleusine coracana subsp. coracana]
MMSISGEMTWAEVSRELPAIDMEFGADQMKRGRLRDRNRLRKEKKSMTEKGKNPSTRDEEEDIMVVDEEEVDQHEMRMYRSFWEQCFGALHGSFEKTRFISAVDWSVTHGCDT